MKKSFVICASLALALMFTGCKSSESAYKKAYEKAKAAESATAQTEEPAVETPVVTPMVETPATRTTVVSTTTKSDNESVRTEELSVVDGAALKNYSVVVGSFSLKANAEGLAKTLRSSGYESRIAYNAGRNMYRVVASSFNTKSDAVASRDQLREKYPDAWLLFQK
jgi:cell division protein FtsN